MSTDKHKLVEFGGYVNLNRHWAYSLLKRMNFVLIKATTAKSKYKVDNFKRNEKPMFTWCSCNR